MTAKLPGHCVDKIDQAVFKPPDRQPEYDMHNKRGLALFLVFIMHILSSGILRTLDSMYSGSFQPV
jgi:hypothetical protein